MILRESLCDKYHYYDNYLNINLKLFIFHRSPTYRTLGRMRAALVREVEATLDHYYPDTVPRLASVFWGGGTPSLMEPETVAAVLAAVRRRCAVAAEGERVEVTLEVGPRGGDARFSFRFFFCFFFFLLLCFFFTYCYFF